MDNIAGKQFIDHPDMNGFCDKCRNHYLLDGDESRCRSISLGMSDTQLYKQAGNSICVGVLYHIYKNLYNAMPYLFDDLKVSSFFSGIGAFEKGLDRLYAEIN